MNDSSHHTVSATSSPGIAMTTPDLDPDVDPAVDPVSDGFVTAVVTEIERDTDDSIIVTLSLPPAQQPSFQFRHGQHITVRRWFDSTSNDAASTDAASTEVRRSYSLCSTAPDGPVRIAIKRVDGGAFSTWATNQLTIGDTIDVMPPTGRFTHELQPDSARHYSLIAAGSGVTPIFSIAATVLASEPGSTVDLLYINRSASSTMLLDDLHELRDRYLQRFRINFLFTQEDTAGRLLSGRPDGTRFRDLIDAGIVPSNPDQVFLCGPEALLDVAIAAFHDAGIDPSRIHRELFTTSQLGQVRTAPQPLTDTSVALGTGTATLHGRTTRFEIYDGDTVLEAVERVRSDAPFSCRAGVCSTCQARMPIGTVTMDVNVGLSADEVARGLVLTCQARPVLDVTEIAVDFDV